VVHKQTGRLCGTIGKSCHCLPISTLIRALHSAMSIALLSAQALPMSDTLFMTVPASGSTIALPLHCSIRVSLLGGEARPPPHTSLALVKAPLRCRLCKRCHLQRCRCPLRVAPHWSGRSRLRLQETRLCAVCMHVTAMIHERHMQQHWQFCCSSKAQTLQ
jgi:hypothetical protein